MSTLHSPEQIAKRVIERRMGSATVEDLEALAYGYQRLENHYSQAIADRDSAREACEQQRNQALGYSMQLDTVSAELHSARAEIAELRKRVESAEYDAAYWKKMHAYDCKCLLDQSNLLVELIDTLVHWHDKDGEVDKSWWDEARHAVKTHRSRYPQKVK